MKRIVFIGLVLVLTASVVFAGGATEGGGDAVTIRFAHSWGEGDAKGPFFVPALDAFAAEHANEFKIVTETSPGDGLFSKIQVELAADSLPDIWTYWGGSRLVPLVEADMLLPVSEYLEVTSTIKESDISSGAWSLYQVEDDVYGIPLEGYVAAFLVNKDLFEQYNLEYPTTLEEMIEVGKVFQANGIIPFAMGSQGGNPSHFWYSEVYSQLPGGVEEIEALPQTNNFATENALKAAELMVQMKEAGLFPKDTLANGDWGPSFALYDEGRAAMIYTYPWMLGAMSTEMQEKSVPIAVPRMPGATKDPTTFISGGAVYGVVVNKKSFDDPAKKDALIEILNFLTSDALLNTIIKGGVIPTKNYDMDMSSFNDIMQRVLDFSADMDKVTSHYWNIWDNSAHQLFLSSLDELFAGVITPQEFVNQVQASLD